MGPLSPGVRTVGLMRSPGTAPTWRDDPVGFRNVRLRRFGPVVPAGPFAVLDLETTGLDPSVDRVIEVAVVRCDPRGRVESEWSSLVHPERDPGPTAVHGITPTDLTAAPRFAELVETLDEQLDGAVVTAHNLAFDAAFLDAERTRARSVRPRAPGLCTLALDRALHPGRPEGYSLAACSAAAGIAQPQAHRALADARVTAELLGALLTGLPPDRWRPWPGRRLRYAGR